jgi:hypothetical protein
MYSLAISLTDGWKKRCTEFVEVLQIVINTFQRRASSYPISQVFLSAICYSRISVCEYHTPRNLCTSLLIAAGIMTIFHDFLAVTILVLVEGKYELNRQIMRFCIDFFAVASHMQHLKISCITR